MKTLFVLNDPRTGPFGTERSYNGLRPAHALTKRDGEEVRVFLLADAVTCALAGQQTPNGYYNLERLLGAAIRNGAEVGLCGTRMDAPAIQRATRRGRPPLTTRGADRLDDLGRQGDQLLGLRNEQRR